MHGNLRLGAPVPSLVRWGVSPDADLVYRALATLRAGTPAWLAHELGMSSARVAAAIDDLAAAGAVRRSPRGTWRAAPADEAVAALRGRRRPVASAADPARRHHAILLGAGLPGGPYPVGLAARRHAGSEPTRDRIAQLVAAERHEHLTLNPEAAFTRQAVRAALPLDRQLHARGVLVRTCGLAGSDEPAGPAEVHRLARLGGQYRERPEIPVKLMVFDRRIALLPADPVDLAAGALEIEQPAVVAAMVALFEEVWSTARDPRTGGVPPIVLTPREQAIVGLLAEGLTDAAVAQRLGISQRTIAYALRALMDRLGVENRFQLGLVLGEARATGGPPTEAHKEE